MTATKVCPGCARPNAADARFCSNCARDLSSVAAGPSTSVAFDRPSDLPMKCPWCAQPNPLGTQACSSCGRSLGGTAPLQQPAVASRHRPFYKRWWFAVLAVVAIGVTIGVLGSSDDAETGARDPSSTFVAQLRSQFPKALWTVDNLREIGRDACAGYAEMRAKLPGITGDTAYRLDAETFRSRYRLTEDQSLRMAIVAVQTVCPEHRDPLKITHLSWGVA